ncbi:helix-turn-helix domain-containing protein [Foetidibacter luteolus]|uniref:helix-turn-helix domain-containing protein n=1 Tax=Foetidibacter luteolus TaxID=2608880 RepID=UPI00129B804A|nr:helix-turn-helix domain-containing protein [Foetidibacter luteolus]
MRNNTSIPVLDLAECIPGKEFIIKTTECADVPQRMRKPHRISGYKISLLLEGETTSYTDFKKYQVKAPALLFLSPEQVHQHVSYEYHKMVHIAFSKDFLLSESENILSCWECMFSQVVLSIEEDDKLQELQAYAMLMREEFVRLKPMKDTVIRNLLNAFIISAARLGTCETSNTTQVDSSQNKIVRQFKNLTDELYLQTTQVGQYADMLYVTPGHLNDLIKNVTGRTAKQIIDEKRVVEAKRLLFWGEYSVKEIASHMNFEDDAYFNRFFKKHTGQTPALFQKMSREKYN